MVDYIALQVPVLAMVPMTSEARTELIKAGIGIFIDTPQQGVTVIKQVFSEKFPMTANKEYAAVTWHRNKQNLSLIFSKKYNRDAYSVFNYRISDIGYEMWRNRNFYQTFVSSYR